MKVSWSAMVVMVILAVAMIGGEVATAQNCGGQAGGKLCAGGQCCSQWGWCGKTPAHCGSGCQSQCSRRAAEADLEPSAAAADKATDAGQP